MKKPSCLTLKRYKCLTNERRQEKREDIAKKIEWKRAEKIKKIKTERKMPACEEDGMIESQLHEKELLVMVEIHQYIWKALLCH